AERLTFRTEQVLSSHLVAGVSVAPIISTDSTSVVWSGGADYYWGSYPFASIGVVRDPRGNDLWSVPMRVRVATERNDWIQAGLVPASKRSTGWALDAKTRRLGGGVGRK